MSKAKKPNLEIGGVKAVVEMLQGLDDASREKLLANVAAKDPKLAEEIRRNLFLFEDLIRADDRGMQLLLREITPNKLAVALRTASDELKAFLFQNMSKRAAELLNEEIQAIGPQKKSEVEKAQQEILALAKKLEAEGKIAF